jgi:hypothetical protein
MTTKTAASANKKARPIKKTAGKSGPVKKAAVKAPIGKAVSKRSLGLENLSPYASFVAMQCVNEERDKNKLKKQLLEGIEPDSGWTNKANVRLTKAGVLKPAFAVSLVEKRSVTWTSAPEIKDTLNHLLLAFIDGNLGLVFINDSTLKAKTHDLLLAGKLSGWEPIKESHLITAFLYGKSLRTLWLGGLHRSVDVKADSKILSGKSLGSALDPFGDSTFVAGSARSEDSGVSLKRSGVWKGPQADWASFEAVAKDILKNLADASKKRLVEVVHPGLARRCSSLNGVQEPYQIEWAAPESVQGKRRANLLEKLAKKFDMEVVLQAKASLGSTPGLVKVKVSEKGLPNGPSCTLDLEPKLKTQRVLFSIKGTPAAGFEEWADAITSDAEVVRIHYESGHTIANSTLGLAAIQDRDLGPDLVHYGDFADNSPSLPTVAKPYCLTEEKPNNAKAAKDIISGMSKPDDRSLFSWVFRQGLAQLGLSLPNSTDCWLYCDDGSGEIADFIHLNASASSGGPTISLFHVKAAGSNELARQISASKYEVVLGQATKNLRRILAKTVLDKISAALEKSVPYRTWNTDWSSAPNKKASADLKKALKAIGANCNYQVIVVQPHVLKSKYMTMSGPSESVRAQQLRSLIFGAKVMANAAGATFKVVFDAR